jgi:hypothetical protein
MITGSWNETSICGSYVLPNEKGEFPSCGPTAKVIETFWAYKKTSSGEVIANDYDMVLMYKFVDPATWNYIPFEDGAVAKEVTATMAGQWVSTKYHPGFI